MHQYLLSVGHRVTDPVPDEAALAEMRASVALFDTELRGAGAWVYAGALQPVEQAHVVDARGAEPITVEGPFAHADAVLRWLWVVAARDLDTALDWAALASRACRARVEVREFEDFAR
ncbi:YciI family protein [Cellulomonas sp. P22]|uniref:YciI family protein n=1 Tax=Cellulomonas sp. P22 TaxID=3373189 RepID=UPI0037994BA5